ncbi:MAG: nucleotide exchange factor GrpE [gamma proteobacterium symbiont of Bathyaustriella thionipta]|nr:nucleotide exchange factor GrpE [gamma proteobacterium symbiont of Bathyaustriella thionipta]
MLERYQTVNKEQQNQTQVSDELQDAEVLDSEQEETPEAEAEQDIHQLLEDTRNKADEHWDKLMRVQAELENIRKRQQRELENAHKYAIEGFVKELLQVKDSMELGLKAATDEGANFETLLEGKELTLKQLQSVFDKFDVVEIDPQGQPFDPETQQAMSMIPSDEVPPNTVMTVVQKGYTLNGRLIRPAMVMVSSAA